MSNNEVTHHTAKVNGIKLHYVMAGSGEPVVLLHGWPQTWHEWRRLIPALTGKYTVVAPDLRGFGDSDKPAGGYDKRTVAEDVYQLVSHLGLGAIHLVGHDLGIKPLAEDVRGVVFERCGHYLAEEQPDAVSAELLRFFDEKS